MKKENNKIKTYGSLAVMDLCNRNGEIVGLATFDSKFIDKVREFKWYKDKHRNTFYVSTNIPRARQEEYGKKKLRLHQLVLPCKKPFMIDHKNHNGLDNGLENLRVVTNRTNCENRHKVTNKHGLVGVSYHNRDKVFVATIQVNGKNKHVGNFKTKEEAFEAREQYKKEHNIK